MTVIGVPYHLDEYLPDLDLPLEPNAMVTAGLPRRGPMGTHDSPAVSGG